MHGRTLGRAQACKSLDTCMLETVTQCLGALTVTHNREKYKMDFPAFDWPVVPFPHLQYPREQYCQENIEEEARCLDLVGSTG